MTTTFKTSSMAMKQKIHYFEEENSRVAALQQQRRTAVSLYEENNIGPIASTFIATVNSGPEENSKFSLVHLVRFLESPHPGKYFTMEESFEVGSF
ncbi:hypothetical protein IV203_007954 [Nitzschia inconspicua]|uniref:Uncharacterized protein n=1 Tax=Nitzschia inconspicua TaxID=303405 RepID=A0A9K3KY95_9STRA|nr:hypothetical protein IV203_007954 [Nitzschia inconspicua]